MRARGEQPGPGTGIGSTSTLSATSHGGLSSYTSHLAASAPSQPSALALAQQQQLQLAQLAALNSSRVQAQAAQRRSSVASSSASLPSPAPSPLADPDSNFAAAAAVLASKGLFSNSARPVPILPLSPPQNQQNQQSPPGGLAALGRDTAFQQPSFANMTFAGLPAAPQYRPVQQQKQQPVSVPEPQSDASALPWDDLLVDPDQHDHDHDHDGDLAMAPAHPLHPLDPVDSFEPSSLLDHSFTADFGVAHWERLKDVPDFGTPNPAPSAIDFPEFVESHDNADGDDGLSGLGTTPGDDASTIANAFLNSFGEDDWGAAVAAAKDHGIGNPRGAGVGKQRSSDSTVFSLDAIDNARWLTGLSPDVAMDDLDDGSGTGSGSGSGQGAADVVRAGSGSTDADSFGLAPSRLLLDRRSSLASLGGMLEHTRISGASPASNSNNMTPPNPANSEFGEMTVDQALATIARQFLANPAQQQKLQQQLQAVNARQLQQQQQMQQQPSMLFNGFDPSAMANGNVVQHYQQQQQQQGLLPQRRPSNAGAFAMPGDPASAQHMHPIPLANVPGSPAPSVMSSSTTNSNSTSGSSGHQRPPFIKAMPSPAPQRKPAQQPQQQQPQLTKVTTVPTTTTTAVAAASRLKATMETLERERERNAVDAALAARATMEEEIRRSAMLVAAHHKRLGLPASSASNSSSSASANAIMEEEIRRSASLVAAHHKRGVASAAAAGGAVGPAEAGGPKRRIKRAATEPTDFAQAAIRGAGQTQQQQQQAQVQGQQSTAQYTRRQSIAGIGMNLVGGAPTTSSPLAQGGSVTPASLMTMGNTTTVRPQQISQPMGQQQQQPGSQSTPEQWQSALHQLISSRAAAAAAAGRSSQTPLALQQQQALQPQPQQQQQQQRNTVQVPAPASSGSRHRSKTLDSFSMRDFNMVQAAQRAVGMDRHVAEAIAAGGVAPGLTNPTAAGNAVAAASRNRRRSSVMVGELQWRSARAQSPDVASVASSPGPGRGSWIQLSSSQTPATSFASPAEYTSNSFSPRMQGTADMFGEMAVDETNMDQQPRRRRRESLSVAELFRRHQLECDECRNRALLGGPTTGDQHFGADGSIIGDNDGSISSILGAHGLFHGHGFGERFGRRRTMSGPVRQVGGQQQQQQQPQSQSQPLQQQQQQPQQQVQEKPAVTHAATFSVGYPSHHSPAYPGFQVDQASQIIEGLLPLGTMPSSTTSGRPRALSDAPLAHFQQPGLPGSQFDFLVLNNGSPSPPMHGQSVTISEPMGNGMTTSTTAANGRPEWKRHRRPSSLGMDFAGTDEGMMLAEDAVQAVESNKPAVADPALGQSIVGSQQTRGVGLGLGLSQFQQPITTSSLSTSGNSFQQTTHDAMVSLFTERFGWSTEAAEQAAAVQLKLNQSKNNGFPLM